MLPNFIIIGAMKSGTTALYHYMNQHSEVYGSQPKEPMFFSSQKAWNLGTAWYQSFFAGHRGEKVLFEASTTYSKGPHAKSVAQKMFDTLPEAKLAYMVRCPTERIRSHHEHMVNRGIKLNLSEALEESNEYLSPSCYHTRLKPYLRLFPQEQLKVLCFEDFRDDPVPTLKELCLFVDVDPSEVASFKKLSQTNNSQVNLATTAKEQGEGLFEYTKRGPGVSAKRRGGILDRLRSEQASLEEYAGRSFAHWKLEESFDALFEEDDSAKATLDSTATPTSLPQENL